MLLLVLAIRLNRVVSVVQNQQLAHIILRVSIAAIKSAQNKAFTVLCLYDIAKFVKQQQSPSQNKHKQTISRLNPSK
jgi:hypothetical protein